MSASEFFILLVAGTAAGFFLYRWYRFTARNIEVRPALFIRISLGLMPVLSSVIILYTLNNLASFDVVGGWVLFYWIIGIMWLYGAVGLMFAFFDISWIDDALNAGNKAAALAVIGGGLSVTFIYAGANVGDGPGWFCVFQAGGLGIVAFIVLGIIANLITKCFIRITSDRDIYCGARTGAYFIGSGVILGRACAGDWTSYAQTVREFGDGWPVLILTAAFILTELFFTNMDKRNDPNDKNIKLLFSGMLCVVYIVAAVWAFKYLPPLPSNPIYN